MSSDEERGGIPENLTKKILTLGLGAYFLTEDTVRRYVKDAKIPRDIARSITQNATKGKDELYGYVARELSSFLRQMDLQQELDRFVRSHKVRVSAEIEFLPREGATSLHEDAPLDDEEGTEVQGSDESGSVEWSVSFKGPSSASAETPLAEDEPDEDEGEGETSDDDEGER